MHLARYARPVRDHQIRGKAIDQHHGRLPILFNRSLTDLLPRFPDHRDLGCLSRLSRPRAAGAKASRPKLVRSIS